MKNSGQGRRNPQVEASPKRVKPKFREVEYNCSQCFFQGTSQRELNNHINLKHTRREYRNESLISCNNCGEQFHSKSDLMHHRKTKHFNTIALCRNNLVGKCMYADQMCWWNHAERREISGTVECFNCGRGFENKSSLMSHRKTEHENTVKICSQFQSGNCVFRNETCWFLHTIKTDETVTVEDDDDEPSEEMNISRENPVFRGVSEDLEPPIKNL